MSMHKLSEYEKLLEMDSAQKLIALDTPAAWAPLPMKEQLPDFPIDSFPPHLQKYAKAVSQALQAPLDMVCCAVLGSLSVAALGAKVQVWEGYQEPVQLHMCISMAPSEGKSPVFKAVTQATRDWINHENKLRKAQVAVYASEKRRLEKQIAAAETKNDPDRAAELIEELEELAEVRPYDVPITDTTPEALGMAMMRNAGKASIVSAEGGITDVLMGSYSDKPNIDVILQGYSGEAVSVQRVGRDPIKIDNACCAILIAVQPQVLEAMLGNEVLLGRGLCARFLYCVPPSMLGKRDMREAKPVPKSVAIDYETTIMNLTALSFQGPQKVLTLSLDGLEAYYKWQAEIEPHISPGEKWHNIANGWEGKLLGNTVRIAGLLNLANDVHGREPISADQFLAAIDIARFFLAHAMSATHKDEGLGPSTREVLETIIKQGHSPFSPYALRQTLKSRKRFRKGEAVDQELQALQQMGYLRLVLQPKYQGVGRPPEAMYEVYPALFDDVR